MSEKDGKRRRLYTDMRIEEKAVEELEELLERDLTTEMEVVLAVTACAAPDPYYHAIERMGDKDLCIAHLRQEGREVKRLLVTEDFDGFYDAVKRLFLNFTFLSTEFKADKEIGIAAVTQFGNAVEFLSAELRADKGIGLVAVKQNGLAVRHLSVELRADKDVGLASVTQDGMAIIQLSVELRIDKDVGLAAVTQYGLAVNYVPLRLKVDKTVCLAAVKQNGLAVQHISVEETRM